MVKLNHLHDYYQFENLDYLSFFKYYNALPCICGSVLTSLNLATQKNKTESHLSILNDQEIKNEMPKVHRLQSSESFVPDNEKLNQHFIYYIDPRLSENFISVFSSLKKKLLNKGFQF